MREKLDQALNRLREQGIELTLHRQALDCLLREEFTWTERFTVEGGAWFQMGLARLDGAMGGILMKREFYPVNGKPNCYVVFAEEYIRKTDSSYWPFDRDAEMQAYQNCYLAMRAMFNAHHKIAG